MQTRTGWLAWLLTAGLALVPAGVWGQQVDFGPEVPHADPQFPIPLGHDRLETGGFYFATEFLFWRQTNPLKGQVVAVRGFDDTDGVIGTIQNLVNGTTDAVIPGQFFGSGTPALDVEQVAGPTSYQPGLGLTAGWRFQDGTALEFRWRHLTETKYNSVASILPPFQGLFHGFPVGLNLADTFLFSPVYGFPNEFAGPVAKIAVSQGAGAAAATSNFTIVARPGVPLVTFIGQAAGGPILNFNAAVINATATAASTGTLFAPQGAYGIWNGASIMNQSFVQRYDDFDLVGRIPFYQDDCRRWYALLGARHVSMWERYEWRTIALNVTFPSAQGAASVTFNLGNANVNVVQLPTATLTATAGGGVFGLASAFADPSDAVEYSNVVSNRMYGPMIGCGTEWYLGHGFATSLDLRAAAFIDFVKKTVKYERQDKYIANKRGSREYTFAAELDAVFNVWWYPIEGIQMRVGYDVMTFFNTIASPRPVDFNYGALVPEYNKGVFRIVDGLNAGIGFIF